jgi:hypothetical protein
MLEDRIQLDRPSGFEYKVLVNSDFSESELAWWAKYKIDKDLLKINHVFSAKAIGINGSPAYRSTKTNPIYVYSIPLTSRIRIYRPLAAKDKKWRGNTSSFDIFAYHTLPAKSKVLIITSSLKDAMVIQKMGFPSIAPTSESSTIDGAIIKQLKKRFKYIFVLMDADDAGIASANRYSIHKLYDITLGFNGYGKDISDAVANKGFKKIHRWLKKLIKKATKS